MRVWMFELRIRPLAREDIKKIWAYSYKHWGKEQADMYTSNLGDAIQALLDNPELGASIDQARKGYRQYNIQEHLVIYRLDKNLIDVVRVLGKRMDVVRHLKK